MAIQTKLGHRLPYVDILSQLEIGVADSGGCSKKKKKELLIADSDGKPKICHINLVYLPYIYI
ncbi:hypothetical protein MtrunA17_Chr5g0413581 [Medicago truncatula]|uniref:Uncharacterized protein n=1 Tax=Medicago truncatula TaxID=3880 RepID=A0A396HWJ4_MEDTR|nr:hypothetical protein MtrunA17_Chr5g0413581 [Medicago truncatula]